MSGTQKIKCLVWDLDNTLWQGILLQDEKVSLHPKVREIIQTLDERGILLSIASKNNAQDAFNKLEEFKLKDYFIYPEIHWNPKSTSLAAIAKNINISLDSIAFIDDQAFELDEVKYAHPEVLCIHIDKIDFLLEMSEFKPTFITEDSKNRRKYYQADIQRKEIESTHEGSQEEFLSTLDLELTITKATIDDLQRMEELTIRTSQLNTTGKTYSYDELENLINSPQHELLVAELKDKYGCYGKIGLAIIEKATSILTIKLLLMSCRVISRGVGAVLLNFIRQSAKDNGYELRADFVPTDRNRMMLVTYRFNGFSSIEENSTDRPFQMVDTSETIPPCPAYVQLKTNGLLIFNPKISG